MAHSLRVQSIVVGKAWWWSRRPVVHISCALAGEAESEPEVGWARKLQGLPLVTTSCIETPPPKG